MVNNIFNVISLQSFTVFSEYFIALSIIYILIVITLITYNSYSLILQKALSECIALILFMACYLLINDDLVTLDFCSFNHSIINDYFAFFSKLIICFFSGIFFLFISDSLKEQKLTSFEYLIILLFAILGLMLMCSSNDLLIAYLAIELSSLASYVLASFRKTSSYSVESGIKYFITGSVSSAFFLLGSSFIYGISGSINFSTFYELYGCSFFYVTPFRYIPSILEDLLLFLWYLILEDRGYFDLPELFDFSFIEVGLTLILFSLFIKLALAPFHLWSLDVFEGSPTSSTIFFAVIAKLSIFVILVRLCYTSFFSIKDCWQFYSLWIGIFSIFVGSFGGLKQRKLKTLLAYSAITNMGYILIALATTAFMGVQMLLFYMIIYMLSGLCVWSIFLFLRLKHKNPTLKYNKELGDFVLLRKSNSPLAFALAITMFSIAGIPPMVGFLAKLSVFLPLIWFSSYFIALASILFSVASTFYYIRIIKILYFENLLVGKLYYPISSEKTVILSILIFLLVFLFINPTLVYLFCYKAILLSLNNFYFTLI
jgi:NADH-quinone oxidoreductase subunit N